MWRGRDWKSSLPSIGSDPEGVKARGANEATVVAPSIEEQDASVEDATPNHLNSTSLGSAVLGREGNEELDPTVAEKSVSADVDSLTAMMRASDSISNNMEATRTDDHKMHTHNTLDDFESWTAESGGESETDSGYEYSDLDEAEPMEQSRFDAVEAAGNSETKVGGSSLVDPAIEDKLTYTSEASQTLNKPIGNITDGVLQLLRQAIDNGSAVVLDDSALDADVVYQQSVAFSQSAPPAPVFRHQLRKKVAVDKSEEQPSRELEVRKEEIAVSAEEGNEKKKDSKTKKNKKFGEYNFSLPQGSLGVDELAKLLA